MKFNPLLLLFWLGSALAAAASDDRPLNPHLEPFRPLLEKT